MIYGVRRQIPQGGRTPLCHTSCLNPEGIPEQSPGLRGTRYPGWMTNERSPTATRLRKADATPVGVGEIFARLTQGSFLFLWNLLTRHERRLVAADVRRLQSGRPILAMCCVPGRPAVRFFCGRRALLREALEGLNSAVTARSTAEPHARSPGRLGARAVPARSTWHGRKGVGYCGLRAHGPKSQRPHVGCYEFMERSLRAANPGLNA